jgi:hypothetical protein
MRTVVSPPPPISLFIMLPLRLCCLVWPNYWPPLPQLLPWMLILQDKKLSLQPQLHMHGIAVPCGLRRGFSGTCWLRLWVHILPETWMSVLCECCVLSVRGFWSGPLPHFRGVLPSVCTCMRETGVWKTLHLQYTVRKGLIIKERKRNLVTKNDF